MPAAVVPRYATHLGRRSGRGRGFAALVRRVLTTDYFPATERVVKRLVWNPAGAMLLAAAVARWRLRCGSEWRGWAIGATRLIERRAAWSGRPRPAGETAGRYFAALPENECLVELARVAEWAHSAPAGATAAPDAEVWAACDRAVRAWTLRRFQRLRASE